MLEQLVEDYHHHKLCGNTYEMNLVLERIIKGVKGVQYIMEQRHLVWVRDPATITEVCQDVLLNCLEQYIDCYSKFFTYYVTSCHRALVSLMTKQNRNPIEESFFVEYENEGSKISEQELIPCPNAQTPFQEAEAIIDQLALKDKLSQVLNTREYDVCCLILDTPYKLKNKEIAEILELSASTVSQIFIKLRRKLSPDFFGSI